MSNKWWVLCLSVCLSAFTRFGSGRRDRAHGDQAELLIFNELCALKDEKGPCKAIKPRFFFDVNTGRCQMFEYGGCGGNDNNFETSEDCEETCVVSDDKDPCHLPEAPGPCRGLVTRYFFDSESGQCRHFFYGGCFGNANNFRSLAECHAKCQTPPANPTTAPQVQTQSPSKAADVEPATTVAEEFAKIEHLVQPNNTNVLATDFSPSEPCFSPEDRGPCQGAERRFAYNPETRRCQMFSYSGCGGNKNNFRLRKHCIHKCIKSKKGKGRRMMIRIRKKNLENIASRSV